MVEMDKGTVAQPNWRHLQAVPETVAQGEQQQHDDPDPPQQNCNTPTVAVAKPRATSQNPSSAVPPPGSPSQSATPQEVTSKGLDVKLLLRYWGEYQFNV